MLSTVELAESLGVSTQRVGALIKNLAINEEETIIKGRNRFYKRGAVKKILAYRGVDYSGRRVISISNNKGGVGKTSIATTLAMRLVDQGFSVLLVDIDPQANSTSFFLVNDELQSRVKHVLFDVIRGDGDIEDAIIPVKEGLSILPSSLLNSRIEAELANSKRNPSSFISNIFRDIDVNFIIFDMSPSFSSINFLCSLASDLIVIPTLLTKFSVEGVQMTLDAIAEWKSEYNQFNPETKILINQVDSRVSTSLAFGGIINETVNAFRQRGLNASMFKSIIRSDNLINRVQSGVSELSANSNFYKDMAKFTDELSGLDKLRSQTEVSNNN